MTYRMLSIATALMLAAWLSAGLADQGGAHHHHKADAHHHDAAQGSQAGRPGDSTKVSRVLRIATLDTMRYRPAEVRIKAGETVKFVVTNQGKLRHEFGIGSTEEQQAHAEMMRTMPDMEHTDPNVVVVDPGETKTLVWEFSNAGTFEAGCHAAGHYEAGMKMRLRVRR